MVLTGLIKIQSFFFSRGYRLLSNMFGRLSRHYRSYSAIDVSQTYLGAKKSFYFRIGIFYSNNSDLVKISDDILYELSNGIIRSRHPASLTLIQGHSSIDEKLLPSSASSSQIHLPEGNASPRLRKAWIKSQMKANDLDIWLIIDSNSRYLETDLTVFIENSTQVVLMTDIPFDAKERSAGKEINRGIYSVVDWVIVNSEDDYQKWVDAGFENCVIKSTRVIDQLIDCYRKKSEVNLTSIV